MDTPRRSTASERIATIKALSELFFSRARLARRSCIGGGHPDLEMDHGLGHQRCLPLSTEWQSVNRIVMVSRFLTTCDIFGQYRRLPH